MIPLLSLGLFAKGFLTGITLTLMLGPVTMIILRYGIQANRTAGVWAATGTWISDFVFIAITYWATAFVTGWTEREDVQMMIYIAGGIALMGMGYYLTRSKPVQMNDDPQTALMNYTRAFLSGFIVNSISPFTFLFWTGAAVLLRMQDSNAFWYYVGLMMSLAGGDFLKAWIAPKLAMWIREKYIRNVQVLAGVFIVLAGLYMIVKGVIQD